LAVLVRIDDRERAFAVAHKHAAAAQLYPLEAEARQLDCNRWPIVVTTIMAGAALFAAGGAFVRNLGG
jgi:hypothetical protein